MAAKIEMEYIGLFLKEMRFAEDLTNLIRKYINKMTISETKNVN